MHEQVEIEGGVLVQRAELIQHDDWQLFYNLTRGWYNMSKAQYVSGKGDAAVESFSKALDFEEKLRAVDDYHIFTAERAMMLKYREELMGTGGTKEPHG